MTYPYWINPHLSLDTLQAHPKRKDISQAVRLRRLKRIFVTEAALWSADILSLALSVTAKMTLQG